MTCFFSLAPRHYSLPAFIQVFQATNPPTEDHQTPQDEEGSLNARANKELKVSELPPELQLKILEELAVPPFPSLECLFEDFHEPWNCSACKDTEIDAYGWKLWPITLDPRISTVCRSFYEEGHKMLYKHHTFVFHQRPEALRSFYDIGGTALGIRDRLAVLLLNFIDINDFYAYRRNPTLGTNRAQGTQTSLSIHMPNSIDSRIPFKSLQNPAEFRASVQHLVLVVHPRVTQDMSPEESNDWDWPLKVDWTTLPKLKTLCLDLRGINNYRKFKGGGSCLRRIKKGASRMKGLNLEKLVIVGLCTDEFYYKEAYKQRVRRIFSLALSKTGKLEFKDWRRFVI
ncbi:hypothetical protein HYALB_00009206 [Hymenoscyphus albidus]|uniref:F-box domain-containing protein n=1 Tax=Hymenoscyphus albidus TaxID=595503 RepID=A0A9N9LRY5_9HELO|nr:hypothetical protein HYALB_00009206 [Hymenoscyphus albidus]